LSWHSARCLLKLCWSGS